MPETSRNTCKRFSSFTIFPYYLTTVLAVRMILPSRLRSRLPYNDKSYFLTLSSSVTTLFIHFREMYSFSLITLGSFSRIVNVHFKEGKASCHAHARGKPGSYPSCWSRESPSLLTSHYNWTETRRRMMESRQTNIATL